MQEIVLQYFNKIINADTKVINSIITFQGELFLEQNNQVFIFSLPALHQILSNELQLSYLQFRQLLYQGTFNHDLGHYGAKIEIHQAQQNINNSLYKLVLIDK